LIHGDLYDNNLGWYGERVVMLDWHLVTQAPSAVDFAMYLAMNGLRLEISYDEAVDKFTGNRVRRTMSGRCNWP
jgi:Ser/Thr protein kinase RdoA (MazF antagonist)